MIKKLQQLMDLHVDAGDECGCQLVIYRNGELICDLVSGHLDGRRDRKVDSKTLFPVFSAGKSIMTTLCHICVEKGYLKYDAPVSDYWQEYAQNGKKDTCVWHLLTHRAAMWNFPAGFAYADRYDWSKACTALEQAPLLGKLGGFHEYHAYTYGILVGRLLEKAVGKPIRQILKEFILDVLEIDDFFWGNPGMKEKNLAKIVPFMNDDGTPNCDEWLEINKTEYLFDGLNPSVNTASTASALAKIHASLIGKGYKNIRLLSDETIGNAIKIRRHSTYPVLPDEWDKFGLGYVVSGTVPPWNRFFGQAGACGSEGFADRETLYAVGLTRNQQLKSNPDYPLRNAISDILGIPHRVW
ncbi:MAG: beta-lactamase family protein [Lentisphaeria bacterium]|nr:beta-lactamase family protein [Lentisphaeria bacterium]